MAKPRSDNRRSVIMSAAIRVIASQGLSAPTATIAKEAGVSNRHFTYFETKADLLNHLYVELKMEMAAAAVDGLPTERDIRQQVLHIWSHWMRWATSCPEKRRTLAHLSVSDDITSESQQIGHQTMAGIAKLLERSRENGPMRDAPLADTTSDFMIRDPANADQHCMTGFEALWRIVTSCFG